jgi:hypothetical protein
MGPKFQTILGLFFATPNVWHFIITKVASLSAVTLKRPFVSIS